MLTAAVRQLVKNKNKIPLQKRVFADWRQQQLQEEKLQFFFPQLDYIHTDT